jgi:hypothetical protein
MSRHWPVSTGRDKKNIWGWPYQGSHSLGNWQSDNAIDIRGNPRTTVYAVHNGIIAAPPDCLAIRYNGNAWPIFGWNLYLCETERGRKTGRYWFYTHINKPVVRIGSRVVQGQVLAHGLPNGGNPGGEHLHLGCSWNQPQRNLRLPKPRGAASNKKCPGKCRK